jgi:hypothetical protein
LNADGGNGFNENWMTGHADMYAEKIVTKNKLFYEYEKTASYREKITLNYQNNELIPKTFTTYYTIMVLYGKRDENGSLKSNNRSMKSLEQSWMRTKSKSFEDYKKSNGFKANTSNNTVYADKEEILHTGTEILFQ